MSNDSRSDVHLAADLDARPSIPLESGVFRLAIFGDFGARSHRSGAQGASPLARRRAWRIDRDDVDRVMAGIAPELHLSIDPAQPPVVIRFSSLDDFHPDRLADRLPAFQSLRSLRTQLETPEKSSSSARSATRAAPRADSLALGLSSGSLLDRIIDSEEITTGPLEHIRGTAPLDELAEFVDRAVRPHTVPETRADQRELIAKVDEVIAATMRILLHHPDFQALEALWRGVDFLARRLDTGESLQVFLLDVSRDELSADLASDASLAHSAILGLLGDGAAGEGSAPRWSLLVGAYAFGSDDVPLLSRLATLGRMAGAPWLASADPALAGTSSFAADPDPDEWTVPLPSDWNELRSAGDAAFLALALPRFLLRLPYGARSDECALPFEEFLAGAPEHESFLWGNPALACALAIGEQVAAGEPPPTHAILERMPLHVATIDGESTATPCAETLLSQRAVVHLLDRGLTPIASARDADLVHIPRLQSVAMPPRPLPIHTGAAS